MKQISTGAGLLGLGVCSIVACLIASYRAERAALAQNPEAAPTVVKQEIFPMQAVVNQSTLNNMMVLIAVRTYSDNSVSARVLGYPIVWFSPTPGGSYPGLTLVDAWRFPSGFTAWGEFQWRTILNGGVGFSSVDEIISAVNQFGDNPTDEVVDKSPQ
jgi:hypothetical protein